MSWVRVGAIRDVDLERDQSRVVFDTTIVVMSGAAGFSPTESW